MLKSPRRSTRAKAEQLLRQLFSETGYVRLADEARRQADGASYKKGYEVRLVVQTEAELAHIYAVSGKPEQALKMIAELLEVGKRRFHHQNICTFVFIQQ